MRLSATGSHAVSSESNPVSAARTAGGGGGGGGLPSYLTNTDDLIYYIDFHNTNSYSGSGTSVTDLSGSEFTTTIAGVEDTDWSYISSDDASSNPAWDSADGSSTGRITATTSSSADFDFGTGDFSIEIWYRGHTDIGGAFGLLSTYRDTSDTTISGDPATYVYVAYHGHNHATTADRGKTRLYVREIDGENENIYSTANFPGYHSSTNKWGDWTHIVITRSGTSHKLYQNGTEIISNTSSSTYNFDSSNNAALNLFWDNNTNDHARLGACRVYKGTALSSSDITAHYDGERASYGYVPTLDITTSDATLTEGETATITFTWSESVTGFADADITTTGGTLSAISGSGTTYTATFTPAEDSTADGVITVGANAVTNANGDANTAGDTLTMSVATAGTATLTFRYHMYGDDMNDFYIFWETSSAATQLWTKSGQQHPQGSTQAWSLATVDMSSHIGETGKISIVGVISANSSYHGDAAFCAWNIERSYDDDFSLQDSTSNWKISTSSASSSDPTDALDLSTTTTIADEANIGNGKFNLSYGDTASTSTGPDKHHDNGTYSRYIYFEQSGMTQITPTRGYIARRASDITI